MKRIRSAVIISILLAFGLNASPINYFVRNGGDDRADGKSDATAWATLSKVSSFTFSPGDTIFLRCGDTWREMLSVHNNGTSGNNIKYTKYGSGDNPRLLGSNITTWSNYSTNVWVSDGTVSDPYSVGMYGSEIFFENIDGHKSWGIRKTSLTSLTSEYNWTYSSGKIYIYSSSDPDAKYKSVEIPQRAYIFDLNYKSFIHIDGIDMFYCGETGITYSASGGGWQDKTGLIIENLEIGYVSTKNSEAGYGTEVIYSDMIIRHCDIHDCGRRSVSLHLYGSYTAKNILVEDCYFHDGFHTTGVDVSVGNGSGMHIDGLIIRRNKFYDPPSSSAYTHHIFLQNYHYDNISQSSLKNVYIYSNIFIQPSGAGINMEGTQSVYVYNNTFYNHNNSGSDAHLWVDNNNALVKIMNNIFYTTSTNDYGGSELFVRSGQTLSKVYADHNLYYRVNNNLRIVEKENTGIYHMNEISQIRSVLGWELNSPVPADPLFLSTNDFHLQANSPALGTGIPISEVLTDFEGKSLSNPPNIGCYTSPGVAPSLIYISSVIENATPSVLEMTYNISLANIVPAASAFTVMVNSTSRSVSSVSISGTKVRLTLSSPVVNGNVVTVAYTKPATNPLQATSGGQAITMVPQQVTNNVSAAIPVYVSSVIENASPSVLEMTYNTSLANIVPAASSFTVMVNSTSRSVSSVSISGTKVLLTISSPVVNGNVVTVAYTKPATNPLQTASGGQAASLTAQPVTNNVTAGIPVYVSSVIANTTPTVLEMTYNTSLANIVPAASAFNVTVNSASRSVSGVSISGTKVRLTLSSPVVNGNVVTVAYSKPATNPLQTTSGGQAASLVAQPVTNNVSAAIPVYVSSVIENATPSVLEITYNTSLANIVPASSAFTVMVNSASRSVSSVSISGTKVRLTLSSPVVNGNVVTIAYTKPATNALQTTSGGQAVSIAAQSVTNNVGVLNSPPTVVLNYQNNYYSGFIGEIDASQSYDANNDALTFEWLTPSGSEVLSTSLPTIRFLAPIVDNVGTIEFTVKITDGKSERAQVIPVPVLPFKPELSEVGIKNITSGDLQENEFPYNITDGNLESCWTSDGNDRWLIIELEQPSKIGYIEVAFREGQRFESFFDIYGSKDNKTWEPILTGIASCNFAGGFQIFEIPETRSLTGYSFIKLVGQGTSQDSRNNFSEFKIFGAPFRKSTDMIVYPNPASDFLNILIEYSDIDLKYDQLLLAHFLRIYDISGLLVFEKILDPDNNLVQIPVDFKPGVYIIDLISGGMTISVQKLVIR